MPWYEYKCTNCDVHFEIQQSMKDASLRTCTLCEQDSLERVIFPSYFFVRPDASTLGQLADRNAKRLGKNEVAEKDEKFRQEEKNRQNESRRKLEEKLPKGAKLVDRDTSQEVSLPREVQKKIFSDKTGAKARKYIETGNI